MRKKSQPNHQETIGTIHGVVAFVLGLSLVTFLLKLPYLPATQTVVYTLLLIGAGYIYLRAHYHLPVPLVLVGLLVAAVGVDTTGNYLHLYGHQFGPVMYDEFSHFSASMLTMPVLMWLLRGLINRGGERVPLSLVTLFAITCGFSVDALYEVVELWDELYFGGKRIWGPYDAPRDLQWDLAGSLAGALATYLVIKIQRRHQP